MVRAKFKVDSKTETITSVPDPANAGKWIKGKVITVEMSPVYGNGDPNHENTKFWNASPSGSLKLSCANAAAAGRFELGREYYLDFSPAAEPAAT